MPCVDPTCRVPRVLTTRSYGPFDITDRDPIVEHCECGQHPRVWSVQRFLRVWMARPHNAG